MSCGLKSGGLMSSGLKCYDHFTCVKCAQLLSDNLSFLIV